MTFRTILPGMTFLFIFSSCSKPLLLLPAATGSYAGVARPETKAVTAPEKDIDKSPDEVILTAASGENQPEITTFITTASPRQNLVATGVNPMAVPERLTVEYGNKENIGQHKAALNYRKAAVRNKSTEALNKAEANKDAKNIFSILSIACLLTGISLILFGIFYGFFLFIPAVIFGILGLSGKESLKILAKLGLIIGILGAILLIIVAATVRPGK